MLKTICSIHDTKAQVWITPMFFQSAAQAVRSFGDVVNERGTEFNKHPEDYILFKLGEFDERTGELVPVAPESLAVGINLKVEDQ